MPYTKIWKLQLWRLLSLPEWDKKWNYFRNKFKWKYEENHPQNIERFWIFRKGVTLFQRRARNLPVLDYWWRYKRILTYQRCWVNNFLRPSHWLTLILLSLIVISQVPLMCKTLMLGLFTVAYFVLLNFCTFTIT